MRDSDAREAACAVAERNTPSNLVRAALCLVIIFSNLDVCSHTCLLQQDTCSDFSMRMADREPVASSACIVEAPNAKHFGGY